RPALAPGGVPGPVAQEEPTKARAARDPAQALLPDPEALPREPHLGCGAHRQRAAPARLEDRQHDGRPVHASARPPGLRRPAAGAALRSRPRWTSSLAQDPQLVAFRVPRDESTFLFYV